VEVSVTDVPDGKLAVHVEGQFIPAGLLVTVPVPVTVIVNWKFCGGGGGGGGELLLELPAHAARVNKRTKAATERSGSTVNRRLIVN
jgi:hypothetical protein